MRPTAAVDIGSNTVHLLVGIPHRRRAVEHVESVSALLELGREVERHGRIRDKTRSALREVLHGQLKAAKKAGARTVLIAATKALREASNGRQTAAELSRVAGVPVHVLSPRAEARLTLLGSETDLDPTAHQVLIDSGGASTEVTLTAGRRPVAGASIPLGASLLCAKLKGDPPGPLEWAGLALDLGDALKALPSAPRPVSALAVGGTAHRIEELHGEGCGAAIGLPDLEAVARRLLRHTARHIARATGIEKKKITLVAAGALILHSILGHYELDRVHVGHRGLRDGMIAAFQEIQGNWWRYT